MCEHYSTRACGFVVLIIFDPDAIDFETDFCASITGAACEVYQ